MTESNKPLPTAALEWFDKVSKQHPNLDQTLLKQAAQFSYQHAGDAPLPYGRSALHQGIAMANALLEMNCDQQTMSAAILYPCIHYRNVSKELLIKQFEPVIYKLILGVERMEAIHGLQIESGDTAQQMRQIDNLRKMLLAMVDDIRVVLIKLVEQLTILYYLRHCSPIQQQQIAEQTLTLYAPLANRLGIGQLKWQMEDLAFRYTNKETYFKISKALNMRRTDREHYIQLMMDKLHELLSASHVDDADIMGRAKHIYSIYRKLQRKQVELDQIYDTSAVRILVPSIKDCYTALSIAHATWEHIPHEFDDYIAKPKPNGYRSIHTAVIGPEHINVEIQIRTYKMHEEAELGVAAHWKYKEGGGAQSTYEEKINWLREVMDWQKEISADGAGNDELYANVFDDRVYAFTPNGDVFDLVAGATPLDFAYHVHTDVGNCCKGAKVNGVLVPLTHPLKTGDQVAILTSKEGTPSRDWLNSELGYLKTNQARSKVRHFFKRQHFQEHLNAGQAIWEKAYRRSHLKKNDLQKVVQRFNFKTTDDLLAALGSGDLGVATVINQLRTLDEKPTHADDTITIKKPASSKKTDRSDLVIEGVGNLLTQIARCCKPIPGDAIIGYITKGRGISIHQKQCRNIQQAITYRPQRIIEVHWGQKAPQSYAVDLSIHAEDRGGLVRDITNVIANKHLPLIGLNSRVNKIDNAAYVNLTIEVDSLEPLQKIVNELRQLPGVMQVTRR